MFTFDALPDHWRQLDEFEGDGYDRVVVTARLADERTAEAYIYALRGPSKP